MLRALGIRSLLVVPLRVPSRSIGALTLATDFSLRRLGTDDVELAEQLGRRVAVAVENARLHAMLTEVAETLQRALLPADLPAVPGWDLAALYRPIETELRFDVGGDFYEFLEHEGTPFAIFGDVAGKGVSAASVTPLLRHGARVASHLQPSPAAILTQLDEALSSRPGEAMATALCLCLHPGKVVISSAGHPPAMIVSTDGTIREAPRSDPMLGVSAGLERHEEGLPIAHRELMVLYTDGVIDACRSDGERFGADRLRRELSSLAGMVPAEAVSRLQQRLDAFTAGQSADDVALLVLSPQGS
jgi:serine phosphatase RsbU (regulator of sigma subunit)